MKRIWLLSCVIGLIATGGAWSCSDSESDEEDEGSKGNNVGDPTAPDLSEIDTEDICYEADQEFSRNTSKVMLLQDISSSMNEEIGGQTKWEIDQEALINMVTRYGDTIEFGLDFFPVDRDCGVGTSVREDTSPNNGDNLAGVLAGTDTLQTTPLLRGMNNFLDPGYAPNFLGEGASPYLVVVSDGADSCGGLNGEDVGVDELEAVTSELLDSGIRTFAIGFGSGVDAAELNAIAEAGGTPFDEYFNAQDEAELNEALESIGEAVVVSCSYTLGNVSAEANRDYTNIYFDGEPLRRGDSCDGADWTWGNSDMTTIEFCADACELIESGDVEELNVIIMCSADSVVVV